MGMAANGGVSLISASEKRTGMEKAKCRQALGISGVRKRIRHIRRLYLSAAGQARV